MRFRFMNYIKGTGTCIFTGLENQRAPKEIHPDNDISYLILYKIILQIFMQTGSVKSKLLQEFYHILIGIYVVRGQIIRLEIIMYLSLLRRQNFYINTLKLSK